jgi:hypothetical protein
MKTTLKFVFVDPADEKQKKQYVNFQSVSETADEAEINTLADLLRKVLDYLTLNDIQVVDTDDQTAELQKARDAAAATPPAGGTEGTGETGTTDPAAGGDTTDPNASTETTEGGKA